MIRAKISNFAGNYAALNNPSRDLPVSRLMLARSVMTAGQAGIRDVARLGFFRLAELFCMTYANTRMDGGSLILSDSFWMLEQSERVGISYRLGMGLAKASAEILLRIPWLVHLDRVPGAVVTATGNRRPSKLTLHNRSRPADRPDLIGFEGGIRPHVFEAKGHSSGIQPVELQHAIDQVSQVVSVNGSAPATRVVSFFDTSQHPMFGMIIDPDEVGPEIDTVDVKVDPREAAAAYYSFVTEEVEQWSGAALVSVFGRGFLVRPVGVPNYYFGIDAEVFSMIRTTKYTLEQIAELVLAPQEISSVDNLGISIGLDGTILGSQEALWSVEGWSHLVW